MKHIDTRKEDINVDYLLRGIQHRIRNKTGISSIPLEEIEDFDNIETYGSQLDSYNNIDLSPELYFTLDYASKLYDPRSVPGNTRFYKAKKLMMRFFRLYATRQVEFNAAILKISNRYFDIFHNILEKFEYFRKAEVMMHKRIERNEKITRNTNKRLDLQQSRLEYVEDFGIDISFLRRRIENVEDFEKEIYLARQRIENLENWEKNYIIQRKRIEKLETWEEKYNIQRERIEKLETWEEKYNIQRKRIEELEKWEKKFNAQRKRIEELEKWEKKFNIQRDRIEKLETWEKNFNNQRKRIEKLETWEKDFNNLRNRIEDLETWDEKFNTQRNRIEDIEKWEQDFNVQRKRFEELEKTNRKLNKRLLPIENLKERFKIFLNENTVLRQRIEHFMANPKAQIKSSGKSITVPSDLADSNIYNDHLYFPYLNTDRAIEDVVKELVKPYISFFSKAKTAKNISNPFIIDIGCGRGEFLDNCRAAKIPAKGIDINEDMVNHCVSKKLDVKLNDGVSYLQTLENNSVKGIFACHVIEHISPNKLLEFLRLCSVKLAPGGKLVLETPNPTSFFALSMFYRDFTHKQPIHPKTISFLLDKLSFQNIKIKEIHPTPEKFKLKSKSNNNLLENTNTEKLNNTLYGYLDYSVLATK